LLVEEDSTSRDQTGRTRRGGHADAGKRRGVTLNCSKENNQQRREGGGGKENQFNVPL